MSRLVITVHWLDGRYHGLLARDGPPEWPPSPFRLFQALVCGVASRGELSSLAGQSLAWLQTLRPPMIVAPRTQPGQVVTHFVPNNDGDRKPDRQDRLKGKTFRPTLMIDPPDIHYVWQIQPEEVAQANILCQAARHLICLGWGIDVAFASGKLMEDAEVARMCGARWHLQQNEFAGALSLRVPIADQSTGENTLDDLKKVYQSRLDRIQPNKPLRLLQKPRIFKKVTYGTRDDSLAVYPGLAFAAFGIFGDGGVSFRPFDTVRQGLTVAGMLRYATKIRAESAGWSRECIDACILGHGEARGSVHVSVGARRFAFLPLPSIEIRGGSQANVIGSIRRAMLTAFSGNCEQEMAWAQRILSGQSLIDERTQRPVAILSTIPPDAVLSRYTGPAVTWASVTPVVLPGYDDPAHYRRRLKRGAKAEEQKMLVSKLEDRTDALLRKAIVQAGLPQELADHAELEWRKAGFWAGTELADAYGVPDHLKRFPRVHVRIRWRDRHHQPLKMAGPLCFGGGRFCGLGLLAGV